VAAVLLGRRSLLPARAVHATVCGAGAARSCDLLPQRLTRAKDANARIVARDANFVGIVLHGQAVDLDALQRRRILGFQCLGELGDALTDHALKLYVGLFRILFLARVRLVPTLRGSGSPVVIDDGVAKHAIEPANRGLANRVELLHAAHERVLQDLFGCGAIADALLNECKEVAMIRDERRCNVLDWCRFLWSFHRHSSAHFTA
jgi:hypothetical protein